MNFYWRCFSYFKKDVPRILGALGLIFLATLAGLLQPFPLAILIDLVLGDKPASSWLHRLFQSAAPADRLSQVVILALCGLGLSVISGLLSMAQTMANVRVGYRGLVRVRTDLFKKLQELSIAYHRSQPQGDLIYRLSYDVFGIQTILNVIVGNILVGGVTLIVMTSIMFAMNWRLALISICIVPPLMVVHRWSGKRLRSRWITAKEIDSQLTTHIQRSVASMGLVQAFGREEDELQRFTGTVERSVGGMMKVHWQEVLYGLAVSTIIALGTGSIFAYGGYLVYHDQYVAKLGDAGMTVGGLYVFITYLAQFYAPLNSLTGSGATMASGAVGANRVFEILDRDPVIFDRPGAVELPRQAREMELRGLGFEYAPGQPVLCDVSAKIPPGKMVAFVGPSGVGKSTLLNLIPRFYDPTAGAILLDGRDIRGIKLKSLRKHVALVLQESLLLPTTIGENIRYGRPDAPMEAVRKAAAQAGVAEFIESLPEQYDTPVGEQGSNLSGGQKQRIAIARALLTEAPIIVLDEPTSALDAGNEELITQTLVALKGLRTIVIVSHRLSTVADADEIYVMAGGRVIERGTHGELIEQGGAYYKMARHQMKLDDTDDAGDLRKAAEEPAA